MWFVYVLYNAESNKIYVGQTANIDQRLAEHNKKRGNHFTAKVKGEWVIIYKEQVKTKTEALLREKQLKSYKGREFVKKHIRDSPPAGGQEAVNSLQDHSAIAQW